MKFISLAEPLIVLLAFWCIAAGVYWQPQGTTGHSDRALGIEQVDDTNHTKQAEPKLSCPAQPGGLVVCHT